jgi:DNA-binding XRE family transcriptional regulator
MRTTRFNMKDFGTRLRKLRQACGMTQEEFCDRIGISDTHYRKIESGSRTGSLELIRGDGRILPCQPGLPASRRDGIQQQS